MTSEGLNLSVLTLHPWLCLCDDGCLVARAALPTLPWLGDGAFPLHPSNRERNPRDGCFTSSWPLSPFVGAAGNLVNDTALAQTKDFCDFYQTPDFRNYFEPGVPPPVQARCPCRHLAELLRCLAGAWGERLPPGRHYSLLRYFVLAKWCKLPSPAARRKRSMSSRMWSPGFSMDIANAHRQQWTRPTASDGAWRVAGVSNHLGRIIPVRLLRLISCSSYG